MYAEQLFVGGSLVISESYLDSEHCFHQYPEYEESLAKANAGAGWQTRSGSFLEYSHTLLTCSFSACLTFQLAFDNLIRQSLVMNLSEQDYCLGLFSINLIVVKPHF